MTLHALRSGMRHAVHLRGYWRRLVRLPGFFDIDYRFLRGYSFPPQSVCLILSEKCNLRCRMCDIGSAGASAGSPLVEAITAGEEAMLPDDWLRLIDDLARFKPRPLVLFTGTEPFLYPHIREIVEHAVQARLPVHITTNGTLLEAHAPWLAAAGARPDALDISVSLDGLEAVHDEIRGVAGTFARAVRGIAAYAEALQKYRRLPAPVNITCTISDSNCRHLESLVDGLMAMRLPVASVTFNHLWFKDGRIARCHNEKWGAAFPVAEENLRGVVIENIDLEEACAQIGALRRRYRGRLRIHQMPELNAEAAAAYYGQPCRFVFYDKCTALWRNVGVTPRGRVIVSPLCFLPSLGTVKQEPFSRLWNGAQARNLRRMLRKAKAFPACSRCCMLFGSKPKYYKLKDWLS